MTRDADPPMRLSDTEWTVMRAVWARTPASARDVLDEVGQETGWAYTTVKTLLTRLVEKGALSESRRANTNVYEPRITRNEARGSALRSLIDRAFDGTFGSLFQHLMTEERLSRRDLQALERMLREGEGEPAASAAASAGAGETRRPAVDSGSAATERLDLAMKTRGAAADDRTAATQRPDSAVKSRGTAAEHRGDAMEGRSAAADDRRHTGHRDAPTGAARGSRRRR